MQDPQAVYTKGGRPGTRGKCPVCEATMFRMGETPSHAGIPKPDPPKKDGKLVIVESPAKARTVGRFLGNPYRVRASIGHVRDLLRSRLSVDVENDFEPSYRVPNEKKEVVKELQEEVKKAGEVYLATDPDREGEAIAWHLMEAAKISKKQARRVVFHEITRDAIDEAFSHPHDIDMQLVNAQQARRILDRLVGYKISPLLWKNVRNRTTAGRVQSVALRLVVEREREIEAFVPVEYWSIDAELTKRQKKRRSFTAKLHRIGGEEVDLKSEEDTQKIVDDLEEAAYVVTKVRKSKRRRNPSPPYTTSTMQQEASRRLGFTAKRTMAIAQQLYVGVEIGDEGLVGLITYMRTDSVNVAAAAQEEARAYIAERFGAKYRPAKPRRYKTKTKGAQEAHEAIRPTSVHREPKAMKQYLTRDQYRLYDLIWKRFLASQMSSAIFDTISVDIVASAELQVSADETTVADLRHPSLVTPAYLFRSTGSSVRFRGFLIIYQEAKDEDEAPEEGEGKILPPLSSGEILDLLRLLPEQHFTKPPPRYSEATLIRTLEGYGIGRPSTYAPIVSIIQTRGYVDREDRRLVPTEIGFIVNDLLVKHFPDIINVDFTARMEADLDLIASGEREWVPMLREFYGPFEKAMKQAELTMEKVDLGPQETGEICEKCGHPMVVKFGRYGKFIACSNYPECRNTKSYQIKVGVACPECGGDLVEKRTRRKRIFYGCSNYPECEFATWNQPLPQPCPNCSGLLTAAGKDKAKCVKCEEVVELEELGGVEGEGKEEER
ncbi:MAG: type I DNA topoisomerase [Anaerolineae bacterium]|nr:type I DNA topoisomerase [Anaerolineae bacterium]